MRAAVTTLGCRLNQFESDAIERALKEAGWEVVTSPKEADLHVINSCTITNEADADTRQLVRRTARNHPQTKVVVTGCYANAAPGEVAGLDGVAWVLGNADKSKLVEHLRALKEEHEPTQIKVTPFERQFDASLAPALPEHRSRIYLKVQDGCDYRCSFCIVPSVRGPSRSLPLEQLLDQLDELVEKGAPEVVLTGIHLGTYGRDLVPRIRFVDALTAMLPRLGNARLRLSSLDPHEVSDDLIGLMADNQDKICRHLHLPVQSGDPDILKRMRRAHTSEQFAQVTQALHEAIEGIAIGADVIVGFPGESDAQHRRTRELLEQAPITSLHVFSYSKRAGTVAADMADQIPKGVKAKRSEELRRLSAAKQDAHIQRHLGQTLQAVMRREPHPSHGRYLGVTDNFIPVQVATAEAIGGRSVKVTLSEHTSDGVQATLETGC